jgi:hypothetical protein
VKARMHVSSGFAASGAALRSSGWMWVVSSNLFGCRFGCKQQQNV